MAEEVTENDHRPSEWISFRLREPESFEQDPRWLVLTRELNKNFIEGLDVAGWTRPKELKDKDIVWLMTSEEFVRPGLSL